MRRPARTGDLARRLYTRNHRLGTAVTGIVASFVAQVLVGVQRVQLPNSEVVFPYRRLLPLGLALSVLCVLGSDVMESERIAARNVRWLTRRMLCGLVAVAGVLEIVEAWVLSSVDDGITAARSVLVWVFLGGLTSVFFVVVRLQRTNGFRRRIVPLV